MTLEEILKEIEEDTTDYWSDDNQEQDSDNNTSDNEPQNDNNSSDEDLDELKLEFMNNFNRLLLLKDLMVELSNFKQDNEIGYLLSKIRQMIFDVSQKIKSDTFENDIAIMNSEMEKIIKMIIVFLKNKIESTYKVKVSNDNEVSNDE